MESKSSVGSGWGGVVEGDEVGFGRSIATGDLRMNAIATRRDGRFGYRAINAGDVAGDGSSWFAVAGPGDDENGTGAGAVALLPVPD
ncbi:MAG: hypothetical protein FJ102_26015 [Deltaproteobacteria bacterium]|nr:hypothetical protein [Deltaproteobacteria bacterium]